MPTPAAKLAVLGSGKVAEAVRVEADAAFLGDEPGVVAAAGHVALEPESIDLAVSLLSLQDENDIPGMLIQIRRALRPDGLFLGVMAGAGTLAELRESLLAAETELTGGASPRVMPFADVRDAGALLQRAGFALPVADVETVTVRYASMFGLMADLRAMGATNALLERSRRPATRAVCARGRNLCGALFRPGRPGPGDILARLAVRLGARRVAAEAAEAGIGKGFAGDCARRRTGVRRRIGPNDYWNACCSALSWSLNMSRARFRLADPATMASDSTATMRPYSMAVAPLRSLRNRRICCMSDPPM